MKDESGKYLAKNISDKDRSRDNVEYDSLVWDPEDSVGGQEYRDEFMARFSILSGWEFRKGVFVEAMKWKDSRGNYLMDFLYRQG